IHEYEALGGGSGRRLYCRLTSFSQNLQTFLRIILDSTCSIQSRYVPADRKAKTTFNNYKKRMHSNAKESHVGVHLSKFH
ncbi:hypothetical protein, partial [Candidatus Agathobaculum pullicola]|uniref:hypothetical protein n=1 Tax=Candidatus Agathobaculum pullicola TaxID=2838426 RepID=UPI003F93ED8C